MDGQGQAKVCFDDEANNFASDSLPNDYFGPDVLGSPEHSKRESVVNSKSKRKSLVETQTYQDIPREPLLEDISPILCSRHDPESLRLTMTTRQVRCRACDNLIKTQRVQFTFCRKCGLLSNRCTSCGQHRTQSRYTENFISFLNQSLQPDFVSISKIGPMRLCN